MGLISSGRSWRLIPRHACCSARLYAYAANGRIRQQEYGISREIQGDRYALSSQQRTAIAQRQGRFDEEIVSMMAEMSVIDRETKSTSYRQVTLSKDEGNRPDTTPQDCPISNPVLDGGAVTAGNASQLSDGAAACVLMEARLAERKGLQPLGLYRGIAVCGNAPEEMGLGPIHAVPKYARFMDLP